MLQSALKNEWPAHTRELVEEMAAAGAERGIFSTGIENSDPMVDGVRRNQLKEAHDFYLHWEERLERIHSLGIRWLRFGEGYSQVHIGPDTYNFELTDKVVQKCQELDITLIADLMHFGVPAWIHRVHPDKPYFQNPKLPEVFAEYARVFARRYPDIKYFTPVNEPSVTAALSAQAGLWNEQLTGDSRAYIRATANIARAAILARDSINQVRQQQGKDKPIFVLNESFEKFILMDGEHRQAEVEDLNINHLAALDLIFGHRDDVSHLRLLHQGLTPEEYEWFMKHGSQERFILGIDYYLWCVKRVYSDRISPDLPLVPSQFRDVEYELYQMAAERCERYGYIPMLHTEFNAWPENALEFCRKTYEALKRLREDGYPLLGMAWFGDELQIGWHWILSGPRANEETPVGLFYKGQKQPVADLYSEFARTGFPPIR